MSIVKKENLTFNNFIQFKFLNTVEPVKNNHPGENVAWVVVPVCPGCISKTVMCRKLLLGRDIGWGCMCATLWYDFDLTCDLDL